MHDAYSTLYRLLQVTGYITHAPFQIAPRSCIDSSNATSLDADKAAQCLSKVRQCRWWQSGSWICLAALPAHAGEPHRDRHVHTCIRNIRHQRHAETYLMTHSHSHTQSPAAFCTRPTKLGTNPQSACCRICDSASGDATSGGWTSRYGVDLDTCRYVLGYMGPSERYILGSWAPGP